MSAHPPLWRNRDFVLLQLGRLLSTGGSQVTQIAYPLLVLALTGSPAKAGIVAFARTAPMFLLALPAGILADRWNRKRLMIGSDIARLAAIAGLVVAVETGGVRFWQLPLVALVEGLGASVFIAAQAGAFRAVVPPAQLPAAVNTQTARIAAVQVGAPPLGGLLFQLGRALPFLMDAISYLASFVSLALIRTPFQEERDHDPEPLRQQLLVGLRFIWREPFIRTTSFLWLLSNIPGPGVQFALVVIAKRQGLSGAEIGAIVGAFGASILLGSAAGPVVRRTLPPRGILLLEFWCWLGPLAFVVRPSIWILMASMLPVGFAIPNSDSIVEAYRYAVTPDRILGRVETARTTLAGCLYPFGALATGFMLEHVAARWTIAALTLFSVALAVWGTLSRAIRDTPSLDRLEELRAAGVG
ncbi:MAG: MFS transporter [Actinobacteria bacterium]|nr:MFS transporter [Actinomycetota bacterium]